MNPILSALMFVASGAQANEALSQLRAAQVSSQYAAQAPSAAEAKEGVSARFDGGIPAERADAPLFAVSGQVREVAVPGRAERVNLLKPIEGPVREGNAAKKDSAGTNVLAIGLIALVIGGAVAIGIATGGLLGLAVGAVLLIGGRALLKRLF